MNEPEIRPIRVFKGTIDFGIITMRERTNLRQSLLGSPEHADAKGRFRRCRNPRHAPTGARR